MMISGGGALASASASRYCSRHSGQRTSARGVGSRENISGLATDDARDAIDRRVEFKVKDCPV